MSSEEIITFVPEHPLRRCIGKACLTLNALSLIGFCLYAFATGQFQAFRLDQPPKPVVSPPAVSAPVQQRQQPAVAPKVANDCQRQARRKFRAGYVLGRLEKILEDAEKPSR